MSDELQGGTIQGDRTVTELSQASLSGLVGTEAVLIKSTPTNNIVFSLGGKPVVTITDEMGEGKMVITDVMIQEIFKHSPQGQLAVMGLMSMIAGDKTVGEFRTTMNVVFNEFANGLHKFLARKGTSFNQG